MSIESVLKRWQLMTFTIPKGGSLSELGEEWGLVFVVGFALKMITGTQ